MPAVLTWKYRLVSTEGIMFYKYQNEIKDPFSGDEILLEILNKNKCEKLLLY